MKRAVFISSILITSILYSCGGDQGETIEDVIAGNDLEQIRAKRKSVVAEQNKIDEQLKKLDAAISKLDSVKKLPLVTTYMVKESLFNHYLELQGNVKTKQNLVIYPEFSGLLKKVHVREGQKVSKGQVLATIDDGGISQQLAQVKIQTELAKTTFERQKKLWNQKIGSEMEYLQAKTNYEAQQKAIANMESQLEKTIVRAPFAGVIDDVISEQGSVVMPGQSQLIRIVSLNEMYVEAEVPEAYIPFVTVGKKVEVYFPVLNESTEAEVRQVGHYINPNNRSFKIEIGVSNKEGKVKPNLTARLKINDYTNEKAFLIPQDIISENAMGERYAYVVTSKNSQNEADVLKAIIKTGKTQGDMIEVLEGLKNGDAIVQEGARSVKNGQKVKILN